MPVTINLWALKILLVTTITVITIVVLRSAAAIWPKDWGLTFSTKHCSGAQSQVQKPRNVLPFLVFRELELACLEAQLQRTGMHDSGPGFAVCSCIHRGGTEVDKWLLYRVPLPGTTTWYHRQVGFQPWRLYCMSYTLSLLTCPSKDIYACTLFNCLLWFSAFIYCV